MVCSTAAPQPLHKPGARELHHMAHFPAAAGAVLCRLRGFVRPVNREEARQIGDGLAGAVQRDKEFPVEGEGQAFIQPQRIAPPEGG